MFLGAVDVAVKHLFPDHGICGLVRIEPCSIVKSIDQDGMK